MKIGFFGGTFDPPHLGHLIVAQDALVALDLDRVLFVPAARPPHKRGRVITSAAHRLRMLELALAGDDRFVADAIELGREGPSFTSDTLREIHERQPGVQVTLLIGADQWAEFSTWREPDVVKELARVAVLTRNGSESPSSGSEAADGTPRVRWLAEGVIEIDVTRIDLSATAIRGSCAAGHSIRYLVPAAVESYIREHQLYNRNGTGAPG